MAKAAKKKGVPRLRWDQVDALGLSHFIQYRQAHHLRPGNDSIRVVVFGFWVVSLGSMLESEKVAPHG